MQASIDFSQQLSGKSELVYGMGIVDYSPQKQAEIKQFLKVVQKEKAERHRKLRRLQDKRRQEQEHKRKQQEQQRQYASIQTKISKAQKIQIKLKEVAEGKARRQEQHKQFLKKLRRLKEVELSREIEQQKKSQAHIVPREPKPIPGIPSVDQWKQHKRKHQEYLEQRLRAAERQREEHLQSLREENQEQRRYNGKFHKLLKREKEDEARSLDLQRQRIRNSRRYANELKERLHQAIREKMQNSFDNEFLAQSPRAKQVSANSESKSVDGRKLGNEYLTALRTLPKKEQSQTIDVAEDSTYSQKLQLFRKAKIVNDEPIIALVNPLYGGSRRREGLPMDSEEAQVVVERMKRRDENTLARARRKSVMTLQQSRDINNELMSSIEQKLALFKHMT